MSYPLNRLLKNGLLSAPGMGRVLFQHSVNPLLIGLLTIAVYVSAQEREEEAPSLELLEFLGQWETDNGERIDPVELEEGVFEQLGGMEIGDANE